MCVYVHIKGDVAKCAELKRSSKRELSDQRDIEDVGVQKRDVYVGEIHVKEDLFMWLCRGCNCMERDETM